MSERADMLKVRDDDPSLERALRDCRFYAAVLATSKPKRYETYQTAVDGTEVKLSRAIAVVLSALSAAEARAVRCEGERDALQQRLDDYENDAMDRRLWEDS